jgi:hypothetical protein
MKTVRIGAFGSLLAFASMAALAWPLTPAAAADTCFLRGECLDLGRAGGGNCDDQHCFEPSDDCPGSRGNCYAKWPSADLTVSLGGVAKVDDLGDYINQLYRYSTLIGSFIAAIMIILGGFLYVTAGSANSVEKGRGMIKNALIGLFILFAAFLLLETISPDLVHLKLPKVKLVKRERLGACANFSSCVACGETFFLLLPKGGDDPYSASEYGPLGRDICDQPSVRERLISGEKDFNDALAAKYDLGPECAGTSCSLRNPNCKDSAYLCGERKPNVEEIASCRADGSQHGELDPNATCVECLAVGKACPDSTGEKQCCSGFCAGGGDVRGGTVAAGIGGTGVCSTGKFGSACSSDAECLSGICVSDWFNGRCTTGRTGAPCWDNGDCVEGLHCNQTNYQCAGGGAYNVCEESADCGDGLSCQSVETFADVVSRSDAEQRQVAALAAGPVLQTACQVIGSTDLISWAVYGYNQLVGESGLRTPLQILCLATDAATADEFLDAIVEWTNRVESRVIGADVRMCLSEREIESMQTCYVCDFIHTYMNPGSWMLSDEVGSILNDAGFPSPQSLWEELANSSGCPNSGCPEGTKCSTRGPRICTAGSTGNACFDDRECVLPYTCNAGLCALGTLGDACDADSDCASQMCVCQSNAGGLLVVSSRIATAACACTDGSLGTVCSDDSDCRPQDASGRPMQCDGQTHSCVLK